MAQQLATSKRSSFKSVHLLKDEVLGTGSYGSVCKAQCDNLLCAAKTLHLTFFSSNDPGRRRFKQKFEEECDLLTSIIHPNIVQCLGKHYDHESGLPILLMELMDESLTAYLERASKSLAFHTEVNICHDIVQGLFYLHSHSLVHRDLTSNNILLIEGTQAKITDLGMCRLIDDNARRQLTKCPGNLFYMPPEALTDRPIYSDKLDIFSFGVLGVQIMCRKFPEPGSQHRNVDIPGFRLRRIQEVVPEVERRANHIAMIRGNHPLLIIARDCLKDSERDRPTSGNLCHEIVVLKQQPEYKKSVRQSRDDIASIMERTARQIQEIEMSRDLQETAHNLQIQELKTAHIHETQELRTTHRQQINNLQMAHDQQNQELRQNFDRQMQDLRKRYDHRRSEPIYQENQPRNSSHVCVRHTPNSQQRSGVPHRMTVRGTQYSPNMPVVQQSQSKFKNQYDTENTLQVGPSANDALNYRKPVLGRYHQEQQLFLSHDSSNEHIHQNSNSQQQTGGMMSGGTQPGGGAQYNMAIGGGTQNSPNMAESRHDFPQWQSNYGTENAFQGDPSANDSIYDNIEQAAMWEVDSTNQKSTEKYQNPAGLTPTSNPKHHVYESVDHPPQQTTFPATVNTQQSSEQSKDLSDYSNRRAHFAGRKITPPPRSVDLYQKPSTNLDQKQQISKEEQIQSIDPSDHLGGFTLSSSSEWTCEYCLNVIFDSDVCDICGVTKP